MLCAALLGVTMIMPMTESADDPPRGPAPSPEPGAPGRDTLTNALAATRAVDRARFELRTTVAQQGDELTFVHRGAFDDRGGRVQAEADMTQAAATLEAAGQPLDGDWSRPTRMVVAGETVYSQLGPMAESLGREPTDWTSARLVAVMSQRATGNDTLALALDPLGPLDLLERAVVEIGPAAGDGERSVRGEPAEHFVATLALGGHRPTAPRSPARSRSRAGSGPRGRRGPARRRVDRRRRGGPPPRGPPRRLHGRRARRVVADDDLRPLRRGRRHRGRGLDPADVIAGQE